LSIRLARRLQRIRPSATVGITAKALALREQGRDIISLSAGEPDFDTPAHIKAAAIEAIERGDTKYTAIDGSRALKLAVAAKFARDNGFEFAPSQIIVSSGAKQACYNLCQVLLETGDEVVIPAPYWVSYPEMVRLADAEPVIVHCAADNDFLMTPEQLAAAITPQTRLLILNSPCNPSGAAYSEAAWQTFGEVLREHPRVYVLADDIYEHIYWGETPFSSFASACPRLKDRTITVNGVSKSYAMSGWRIGYAAGPEPIIKAMTSIQSQSMTNACSISQAAAVVALNGDQTFLRDMNETFRQRHTLVLEGLNAIEGVSARPGSGACYLLPSIVGAMAQRGFDDDLAFCEALLEEQGVALVPGSAFGAPGHMRISYAASPEMLTQALARIDRFLQTS
jgi:aspartate aminotransferase